MNEVLKKQCQLFIQNRDHLKNHFIWENSAIYPLCASLYIEKELEVDIHKIKVAKELIKEETDLFSNFRGNLLMLFATRLAIVDEPKEQFERVKKLYELFKIRFLGSPYLALAAFALVEQVAEEDDKKAVEQTIRVYEKMRKEHPFLTSKEDLSFASLFAISQMSEDEAIVRMEKCYRLLNDQFFSSNAVQSLTHALAFGEETEEIKCRRVMTLFNRLKENGCKYGTGIELATLGLLALLIKDSEVEETIKEILEVNRYLLDSSGFGAFGIGKVQRLMYAVLIVAMHIKSENYKMGVTFENSIASIMIAQQMAISSVAGSGAATCAAFN